MSTPAMHFGPEWMRKPARPTTSVTVSGLDEGAVGVSPSASSYSALVSPAPAVGLEKLDEAHPFRYSKDELLRIYRENAGKSSLGIEVERWEGVVREVANEPVGIRDLGEGEKKLFSGPLNSDLRRRQSTDFLSPVTTAGIERPRLNHATSASGTGSPLRERLTGMGRRRDSSDSPALTIPRKLSLSGQQPLLSPRDNGLPSPRHRPGFDGVLSSGDSWVARRRASEGLLKGNSRGDNVNDHVESKDSEIKEEEEHEVAAASNAANTRETPPVVPPPVSTSPPLDLPSVDWSYLDPQQQVQGPFRADLMQKWHDEGYFTPDLLMKRTKLDTDWLPVAEMVRRASGAQVFLIPPPAPPAPPPGLGRPNESPVQGFVLPASNGPHQPLPTRSLRTSTLESYLGTNTPSDSPTSSYSANRFGSPDPSAFGGRNGYGDAGRAGYTGAPDSPSSFAGARRNTYHDTALDVNLPRSNSYVAARSGSIDAYSGYSNAYSPNQGWNTPNGNNVIGGGFEGNRGGLDASGNYFGATGNPSAVGFSNLRHDSPFTDPGFQQQQPQQHDFNNNSYNYTGGAPHQANVQYSQSPSLPYQQQAYGSPSPMPMQPNVQQQQPQQSPWNTPESAARRPGPFDAPHPTASNTSVSRPAPQPAWNRAPAPQALVESSWLQASTGASDEGWKEVSAPSTLTADNLGQHNILTGHATAVLPETAPATPDVPVPTPTAVAPVEVAASAATKKTKATKAAVPTPVVAAKQVKPVTPPAPVAPAIKAAWSTEDDGKKANPSNGLREIQDAELKRAQAAKTAERERERANRAAAPNQSDDAPFVASWGLPTSQAGAGRGSSGAPLKDSNGTAGSPVVAATPVWTNAAKTVPVKKTMKEIQDEEERRKKAAVPSKETTAATAARRGYAEKTGPAPQAPVGAAWTTVGTKTPVQVTAPSRPVLAQSISAARVNGSPAPRAPVSAVVKPVAAPRDEPPAAPSQDFLKWLAETLKGLTSSSNVEDIMGMLLTFPMDPDASTTEIISEVIYANSTTLDGRRFAAEFIAKRKIDATSRGRSVGGPAAGGKTLSIADVVKSQPKPSQPEWGAFKVVNKKKKGGRV